MLLTISGLGSSTIVHKYFCTYGQFFTVPTTCSRPSIAMVGFMYFLFLHVHSPGHTFEYFFLKFGM